MSEGIRRYNFSLAKIAMHAAGQREAENMFRFVRKTVESPQFSTPEEFEALSAENQEKVDRHYSRRIPVAETRRLTRTERKQFEHAVGRKPHTFFSQKSPAYWLFLLAALAAVLLATLVVLFILLGRKLAALPHDSISAVAEYKAKEAPKKMRGPIFEQATLFIAQERLASKVFTEAEILEKLGTPDFEITSTYGKTYIYRYLRLNNDEGVVLIDFTSSGSVLAIGYNSFASLKAEIDDSTKSLHRPTPVPRN